MKKRIVIPAALLLLALAGGIFLFFRGGGFADTTPPTPAAFGVARHDNIAYYTGANADPERHTLKIVAPDGPVRSPVAVVLHGGGWTAGSRRIAAVENLAEWLAARGVLAVPLGYRLVSPSTSPTEQPWDVAHGLNWMYRHIDEYGGDPERIVLVGHSAGGHLASLVACDRSYLDELGVPPSVPAGVAALSNAFDLRDSPRHVSRFARRMVQNVFGADVERRAKLSPLAFARPGVPPFLILRGRGDRLVPTYQTDEMTAALRQAGNTVEAMIIDGRGHVTLFHKLTKSGDVAGEAVLRFIREIKPRRNEFPPSFHGENRYNFSVE